MDLDVIPTLKRSVLTKIATELWIRDDSLWVQNEGPKHKINEDLESKVLQKVKTLPIPELLKTELAYLTKPIRPQIQRWFLYLREYFDIDEKNAQKLRWTWRGTIDAKKTAKKLTLDQSLDPKARFDLACAYGLADRIQALRPHTGPGIQTLYANWFSEYTKCGQHHFGNFWSYYLRSDQEDQLLRLVRNGKDKDLSLPQFAFSRALFSYNPVAVKHFYARLNPEEKQWSFSFLIREFELIMEEFKNESFPKEFFSEILCFLLPRMSESEREEILKINPYESLLFLLVWPYHGWFLPTLDRMWECLEREEMNLLSRDIFSKIRHDSPVCVYRDIFFGFWRSSPDRFKRFFIQGGPDIWFQLLRFFLVGEEDICRMILQDANVAEMKRMLRGRLERRYYWADGIYEENEDFVALFVGECESALAAIATKEPGNVDEETKEFRELLDNFTFKINIPSDKLE